MQMLKGVTHFVTNLPWQAAFDVLISTVIIYYVIMLIKGTRAVQLAWGLVLLFLFARIADWVEFRTLSLLLGTIATPGATVAIVILFYPELRHALEEVGRGRFWAMRGLMLRREDVSAVVDELIETAQRLSQRRFGALMVIERDDGLDDIATTGTALGATVTPRLLETIFYPGTPLHDGAVIIRGNEVIAAECVLPLSDNSRISSSLHTRHRAALGLAETTDAAVLVVSEETGNISLAYDGRLLTALRPEVARDKLLSLLQRDESLEGRRGNDPRSAGGKGAGSATPKEEAIPEPPEVAGVAAVSALEEPRTLRGMLYSGLRRARGLFGIGNRVSGLRSLFRGEPSD
ncbi:MAG TPA: diadenylate cyclase CdaA [Armatimonadota bacterium]|nr:diadenylate cyclase CdaA [Armatimonadota bacterium]